MGPPTEILRTTCPRNQGEYTRKSRREARLRVMQSPAQPSLPRISRRLVDARLEAVSHGSAGGVFEELRGRRGQASRRGILP